LDLFFEFEGEGALAEDDIWVVCHIILSLVPFKSYLLSINA